MFSHATGFKPPSPQESQEIFARHDDGDGYLSREELDRLKACYFLGRGKGEGKQRNTERSCLKTATTNQQHQQPKSCSCMGCLNTHLTGQVLHVSPTESAFLQADTSLEAGCQEGCQGHQRA